MRKPRYRTLQEYMERTGTNGQKLIRLVYEATGRRISPPLLSMILRGSRRCSFVNACAFHVVTGVPIEELIRWPRYAATDNSRSVA